MQALRDHGQDVQVVWLTAGPTAGPTTGPCTENGVQPLRIEICFLNLNSVFIIF